MKHIKIFTLISILIFIACAKDVVDTTGTIEGIVKDNTTSTPLQGCAVTLSPTGKSVTTGQDGHYTFEALDANNYSIEYSKVGYEANKKEVTVVAGRSMQVDVMLKKISNALIVNPDVLNFGDLETSKSLFVSAIEQLGSIRYTIKADADWISFSATEGNATSVGNKITVVIDRSNLSTGNYEKSITISSTYGDVIIPVIVNQVERNVATLTTGLPENITETSLTIKGTIIKTGGSKIISYGHCWAESENPTIDNNKTNLGDTEAVGDFTSTLTQLVPGKKYYIRAYAVNSTGAAYSEQTTVKIPFIVKPTVATLAISGLCKDSVVLNGEITNDGDGNIKEHGFYWGYTENTEYKQSVKLPSNSKETKFAYTKKNLLSDTTYYYKAYAVNEKGESCGEVKKFKSLDKNFIEGVPVVETNEATNITTSSATLNGIITDCGDTKVIQRGFYFGTSENSMTKKIIESTDSIMVLNLTGLSDATKYYFKAFAVNQKGENCGTVNSFTTAEGKQPTVVTANATDISYENATLKGVVVDAGDFEIIEYGFYYGTTENSMVKFVGDGSYDNMSVTVGDLTTNTLYYYKAYATTKKGEAYGNVQTFTTLDESIVLPWDGTVATSYGGGSGTYIDPYLIKTPSQLAYMASEGGKSGCYYKLMYDIDLNNKPWRPIYSGAYFDGNGKTISNLYIRREDDNLGLFSYAYGSISNLNIKNVDIQNSAYKNIGALVGEANSAKIENCHIDINNGKIVGAENVGGLIGCSNQKTQILNSSVVSNKKEASILGNKHVGGLIGLVDKKQSVRDVTIASDCFVKLNIKGEKHIGGIFGYMNLNVIHMHTTRCAYIGKLEGVERIGGIVGGVYPHMDAWLHINSSKSETEIISNGYSGGIIGYLAYNSPTGGYPSINSCYSSVTFSNANATNGGIIGYAYDADVIPYYNSIDCCYSVVKYNSNDAQPGGFIGTSIDSKFDIVNSATNINDISSKKGGKIDTNNIKTNCNNKELITHLQNSGSELLSNWNFNKTWTWSGTIDGVSKSITCPRLSWE